MSTICPQCGKPRAEKYPFNPDVFCESMPVDATNYMRVSPLDLDKIRSIVREELTHIIDEQEQRFDEIFKQPKKHDGKLGDERDVYWADVFYPEGRGISIDGKHATSNGEDSVRLHPKHALSLLAWLRQEEETLKQLAKEQEQ